MTPQQFEEVILLLRIILLCSGVVVGMVFAILWKKG